MAKKWDDLTKVEKQIRNAEYTIQRLKDAVETLESAGNTIARMAIEREITREEEWVEKLRSGKYDFLNEDQSA